MVKRYSSKAPTQRQMRVAEFVRSVISDIIIRGDLQHVKALDVSVMDVSVSPDLRYATVYCTARPSGTGKKAKTEEKIFANLNNARKFIRGLLSKEMTSRVCPELEFVRDENMEHASKVTGILHDVLPEEA